VWDRFRADRDAGENLVGLGIVSLGDRDADVERLRRVFEHRAARVGRPQPGCGVVAGRAGGELLSRLDDVVDDSAVELALAAPDGGATGPDGGTGSGDAGDAGTPPGGTTGVPGDDGPGDDGPGGPDDPTPPTTPPTLPPTVPPPTVPPPTVPDGPVTTITDTVDDVVDDVTDVIDDTADEVDDLLGGLLP
jgi:hypothetical protein